jgi:hypothetical protein
VLDLSEINKRICNSDKTNLDTLSKIASYLGLAAVLINVYTENIVSQKNSNEELRDPIFNIPVEDLGFFAIILLGIGNLIGLGISKIELDAILKQNGRKKPIQTKAAINLVISRVLSLVSIIYLVISELQSQSVEEPVLTTPFVTGTIL